jgi:hypothetical protein
MAEVVAGVALILKGCHYSLTHDDTLSNMMYLPAFLAGVLFLVVPGLLLRSATRFGIVGQVLPLLFVGWLLVATLSGPG